MSERLVKIKGLYAAIDRDREANVFLSDEMNASLMAELIDLLRPFVDVAEIARSICDGEDQGFPPNTGRLREALRGIEG